MTNNETTGQVFLTKDQILASRLKVQVFDIPELGGSVRMRELSARRKLEFSEEMGKDNSAISMMRKSVRLALGCIIDEAGAPMFSTGEELEAAAEAIIDDKLEVAEKIVAAAIQLLGFEASKDEADLKDEVEGFTEVPTEVASSA